MKNKKMIGLVPLLYEEYNYGGILQFYALQKIIKDMGLEYVILRMKNDDIICKSDSSANLFKFMLLEILQPYFKYKKSKRDKQIDTVLKERKNKMDKFRQMYYGTYIEKDITDSFEEFDTIICGSDQIWNPKWAKRRTMLVDIPEEINKIIYAASMGCEFMTDYEKAVFKPMVERIQHVSVREESAKKLLNSFIERTDIEIVLDPTLLLTSDEWTQLINNIPVNEKYILTYFLGDSIDYRPLIEQISKENGLKIVNIPYASGESVDKNIFGDYKIYDASPGEFLGLIKNAEIIITDSFHACVFSILFKRKYYVFERKGSTNMIGRIVSLQNHFNLPSRIIKTNSDIEFMKEIDYSYVDKYQMKLREKSLAYLEKSINDGRN